MISASAISGDFEEVKMPEEKINVMVNGLPGKMASKVLEHLARDNSFDIIECSLTGSDIKISYFGNCIGLEEFPHLKDSRNKYPKQIRLTELIWPEHRDTAIEVIKERNPPFISIDFTHPDVVNSNGYFYCRNELPFVMGTTGGDRKALEERVKTSEISAVIAPNMAKQIVAFQTVMEDYSKRNSGSLKDCELSITESHQQGKADTSGTAKAMVKYFNDLGIPFEINKINMVRDPKTQQLAMGVPKEHLAGHGWHSYIISSKQGNDNLDNLALGLKHFLLNDDVFSNYDSFIKREKLEENGRGILWPLCSFFDEGLLFDEHRMDTTYRVSKDRTVSFSLSWFSNKFLAFTHSVNGRDIYAFGTLDATRYLHKKVKEGSKGQVYSMIDVLKGK